MLLSGPTRQQLPLLIAQAARVDFKTIGAVAIQIRDALYGTLPIGMYLSIVCTEDAPRLTSADLTAMNRALPGFATTLADACTNWPRGRIAPELETTENITTPALVISGGLDPATPPASAEKGLANLPNSKHIVVPAAADGPMFPGCVKDIVARFIETKQIDGDVACVGDVVLPPFLVPK